jgi:hypothetical protein
VRTLVYLLLAEKLFYIKLYDTIYGYHIVEYNDMKIYNCIVRNTTFTIRNHYLFNIINTIWIRIGTNLCTGLVIIIKKIKILTTVSGTKEQLSADEVTRRMNFKIVILNFPYTGSSGDNGMTAEHSVGGFLSWQWSRAAI